MFGLECISPTVKPKDMTISEVPVSAIRGIIASNHYSKSMPDSTVICYAGLYGNTLAGVVAFGVGTSPSQYKNIIPSIKDGEYLELTRLWSPDICPKNTESRLVSLSLKSLPSKYKLIVSYADPSQGHEGIIYQATNFHYCGMTMASKNGRLIDTDGKERHQKSLNIYKMRRPEFEHLSYREIANRMGWTFIDNSAKHRYVILRGGKRERLGYYRQMKHMIQPYPKSNTDPSEEPGDAIRRLQGEM
jgi:hypothetical protein